MQKDGDADIATQHREIGDHPGTGMSIPMRKWPVGCCGVAAYDQGAAGDDFRIRQSLSFPDTGIRRGEGSCVRAHSGPPSAVAHVQAAMTIAAVSAISMTARVM